MKFLTVLGFIASAIALIIPPPVKESIHQGNVLSTSNVQRDLDDISIAVTRLEPEAAQHKTLDKRVGARIEAKLPIDCTSHPAIIASAVTITFIMAKIKQEVSTSAGAAERWLIKSMSFTNTELKAVVLKIVSKATNKVLCEKELIGETIGSLTDVQNFSGEDVIIYIAEK